MIGGRRWWLAWPVGILCAGAVAGMVYVAVPAVPWVADYAVGVLRQGAGTQIEPPSVPVPVESIGTALTDDCVSLYPHALWLELALDPHTVLSQDMSAPASELMKVMSPWHPSPRMTCGWRASSGGTVRTSLVDLTLPAVSSGASASTDDASQTIADALAKRGYGCLLSGTGGALLTCTRTTGTTIDTEVIRGDVWLSTSEVGWHPGGYVRALVHRLWPQPTAP